MNDPATGAAAFGTTHWSKIAAAREGDSDVRRESLNFLFSRTGTHLRLPASLPREDLTEEFMIHVLEHDRILRADQARGHFRAFVKAALEHLLSDRRRWEERLKRGGGQNVLR